MRKSKGKVKSANKEDTSMALWGSSVRSRSRPPLLPIPKDVNVIEIPGEWELLPAARMTESGPVLYRVLLRKSPKKFEQGLNGKKRRKSA